MENNWCKVRTPGEHSDKRKKGYNSVYVFAEGLQNVLTRLNKLLGKKQTLTKEGFQIYAPCLERNQKFWKGQ